MTTSSTAKPGGAPSESSLHYRADIDGLRAIAVLAVLAYHAFPGLLPGGFVGVDVFFVISGFLITGILLTALERGRFSLREFYSRRVRRIFPALAVVLAACLLFGWLALFPDEYRQLGGHTLAGAGFAANFAFWREAGYFDNAAATKPLLHLWSLGIEEQFYIVWPLLLCAAHRLRLNAVRWMAALASLSFLVNVLGVERHPTATFYSPAGRAWELALGGLLACLAAKRLRQDSEPASSSFGLRRRTWLSLLGLALLGLALVGIDEGTAFPGWWALLPTVGTALVLSAGPAAWPNRALLATRPMVWIGLISYPLYLWHWPLLSFARIVESKTPSLGYRLAALVLSFGLAASTYLWIERPLRFGSRPRRTVVLLSISMAVVALAGGFVAELRGLPGRGSVRAQLAHQRALLLPDDSAASKTCKELYGFEKSWELCLIDDPGAPPTVALVGDSHAHHHVAGLTEHFRSQGDNLVYLATRIPAWDLPALLDDPTQQVTNRMLDIALNTASVHTVVIATKLKLDPRTSLEREIIEATRRTAERYVAAGKRVVVVRDVPRLDFEPRECIRRLAIPSSGTKEPCAMPRGVFEKETARHDRALGAILREFPKVELFDTTRFLCDAELCWAMRDGQLLFRDRDHLSVDGDLYLGRKFGDSLVTSADLGPSFAEAPEGEKTARRKRHRRAGPRAAGQSGGE